MLLQFGRADQAVELFEQAAKIAQDFYDACNGIGTAYGQLGEYQKAHDCCKKADEIKPNRPHNLYMLAITSRDLGLYDECLPYCDAYDKVSRDHGVDKIRSDALKAKG